MISVKKYNSEYKNEWNNFLEVTKNGSFMFNRDFMDYHSDRFDDFSLLLYQNEILSAIIPLNVNNNTVYSHSGLSFGGLLLVRDVKLLTVISYFYYILKYLTENKIEKIILKPLPEFYNNSLADEHKYILFLLEANLFRRDAGSLIDLTNKLDYQERRVRSIKKALKNNIIIEKSENVTSFWNEVLIPNLKVTHNLSPVHSSAEMNLLMSHFPNSIVQFNAKIDDITIAGATVFINNNVVHAQYISANDIGKNVSALDMLFDELIRVVFKDFKYFSFGVSTEKAGQYLNKGLTEWKEGFGGRTICFDHYEIETKKYENLKEKIDD